MGFILSSPTGKYAAAWRTKYMDSYERVYKRNYPTQQEALQAFRRFRKGFSYEQIMRDEINGGAFAVAQDGSLITTSHIS